MRSILLIFSCYFLIVSCSNQEDENQNYKTSLEACKGFLKTQDIAMNTVKNIISTVDGEEYEYFTAKILYGILYRDYILIMKKGNDHIMVTYKGYGKIKLYKLQRNEYLKLKNKINYKEIRDYKQDENKNSLSSHNYCSFYKIRDKNGVKEVNFSETHGNIRNDSIETLDERVVSITRSYDAVYESYDDDDILYKVKKYFIDDNSEDVFYELN